MSLVKRAAPVVLLVLFLFQSYSTSRIKSPVFDEPAHIAAGLSYVKTGKFHANLQHPPLIKELSGVGMAIGGVRWPKSPAADAIVDHDQKNSARDWDVGAEILDQNGPDRVLAWARTPVILVSALLGVGIYFWGRQMLGETAALGALFLFAVDPTVVAHSFLVTTDVGLAVFTVLFLWALWSYTRQPSLKQQVWCGVALGCALGAKYSGVFLLPIGAALLLASVVWPRERPGGKFPKTAPNKACPCGSGRKYVECHGAPSKIDRAALIGAARAFAVMCGVALVVIEVLFLFHDGPGLYLEGLRRVNADHDPNYLAYLAGESKPHFASYFAAAYLLKEPIAAILLAAIGGIAILRRAAMPRIDKLFLFAPALVLFVAYSIGASNLGIRYIIPVLPFAHLAGGAGLAWLFGKASPVARAAAVGLCAWVAVAAIGIYPDYLSYFNESACVLERPALLGLDGGSRCGPYWLDESNVDWGQGLKQLKSWLERNANGRPVHILYSGFYQPEHYGIRYTPPPATPSGKPELYVVSTHVLPHLWQTQPEVRQASPIAIVGHSYWVYEL